MADLGVATLIGSTGLTGSFLVRQLLADSAMTKVISISRKSLKVSNAKLAEVLISDLAELPSIESKIRCKIYFCCLGTTIKVAGSKENFEKVDHDAVVAFAKIAKAYDARSFTFVSAMGANASSMFFYNRVKGRTEDDVNALRLRSLIIFRPALLVGPRQEFRLAERIAAKTLVPLSHLLPTRIQKSLVTEVQTLATRMLAEGKVAPGEFTSYGPKISGQCARYLLFARYLRVTGCRAQPVVLLKGCTVFTQPRRACLFGQIFSGSSPDPNEDPRHPDSARPQPACRCGRK
jgi:uncharacterized protein YbjT (DUF2867 family)